MRADSICTQNQEGDDEHESEDNAESLPAGKIPSAHEENDYSLGRTHVELMELCEPNYGADFYALPSLKG
jgi:hypothetical protein